MSPKRFLIIIVCLLLLTIGLLVWQSLLYRVPDFVKNPPSAQQSTLMQEEPKLKKPLVRATDPIIGNLNAPLSLIIFSDFQCPYCAEMAETLTEVQKKYPEKVKIVWKDAPNEQRYSESVKAAEAARCADEQKRFADYHNALFLNQDKLGTDFYLALAKNLGLKTAAFSECLNSNKWEQVVRANLAEAAALGITATPYLFINERRLSGVVGQEELEKMIKGI